MGCYSWRKGGIAGWSRQPRQLLRCQQWWNEFVYRILGFIGEFHAITLADISANNLLSSSKFGRCKKDTPIALEACDCFVSVIFRSIFGVNSIAIGCRSSYYNHTLNVTPSMDNAILDNIFDSALNGWSHEASFHLYLARKQLSYLYQTAWVCKLGRGSASKKKTKRGSLSATKNQRHLCILIPAQINRSQPSKGSLSFWLGGGFSALRLLFLFLSPGPHHFAMISYRETHYIWLPDFFLD